MVRLRVLFIPDLHFRYIVECVPCRLRLPIALVASADGSVVYASSETLRTLLRKLGRCTSEDGPPAVLGSSGPDTLVGCLSGRANERTVVLNTVAHCYPASRRLGKRSIAHVETSNSTRFCLHPISIDGARR
jgi:hypothetical protein